MAELLWISKTTGVCGGKACIGDTRIPVWMLVRAYQYFGDDVLKLTDLYDVTLAEAQYALRYYETHISEIDEQIKAQIREPS